VSSSVWHKLETPGVDESTPGPTDEQRRAVKEHRWDLVRAWSESRHTVPLVLESGDKPEVGTLAELAIRDGEVYARFDDLDVGVRGVVAGKKHTVMTPGFQDDRRTLAKIFLNVDASLTADFWVEVSRVGRWNGCEISAELLEQVAAEFTTRGAGATAPIVLNDHRTGVECGQVTALRVAAGSLLACFSGVGQDVRRYIRRGGYRDVSASLLLSDGRLDHVAILGGHNPGVRGMVSLAESLQSHHDAVTLELAIFEREFDAGQEIVRKGQS